MSGHYRIVRSRRLFRGRVFDLFAEDVVLRGARRTTLHIVRHPGAVAIVPVFANGDVLLIRQVRVAAGGEIVEIPAGTLEPGEPPRRTARRELVEETGHRARRWTKLAEFFTAPGFCTEEMHLYLARELAPASAERDADEVIRPLRVPFAKALAMIERGRIRDAKSIAGLLLAHRWLGGRERSGR